MEIKRKCSVTENLRTHVGDDVFLYCVDEEHEGGSKEMRCCDRCVALNVMLRC